MRSVRKGGRICLFGAPPIGSKHELDLHDTFTRQIRIVPSYSCVESEIQETLQLISEGKVDLATLITNRYRLQQAVEALENARSPTSGVKTVSKCARSSDSIAEPSPNRLAKNSIPVTLSSDPLARINIFPSISSARTSR